MEPRIRPPRPAPFAFAKAALTRRQGADCGEFLQGLAGLLAYGGELPTPSRRRRLEASVAVLGTNLSRSSRVGTAGGGFVSKPPGAWMATKLLLADGQGEMFLNINEAEGIGEFSITDADYAATVVGELAKVLLPMHPAGSPAPVGEE